MITDNITKLIGDAMKAHDEVRLSTMRLLSSALNYEFIAKQHPLNEEEQLNVVRKEAKKRRDAIEAYKAVKAFDRAEKEEQELKILEEFLPAQMSDTDLEVIVDAAIKEIGASQMSDMGKVIGIVMQKTKGTADGSRVSLMAKSKLI
jgi:uncharacterized protein